MYILRWVSGGDLALGQTRKNGHILELLSSIVLVYNLNNVNINYGAQMYNIYIYLDFCNGYLGVTWL